MTAATSPQLLATDPPAQRVVLPATPAAAGVARRFLTGLLRAERPDVVDVAVLLTSELVGNAVLHGRAPIRLQLLRRAGRLRIEVGDDGPPFALPAAGSWSLTGEGGRGLMLLDALAGSWGSESSGAGLTGKTLWFELASGAPGAGVVA